MSSRSNDRRRGRSANQRSPAKVRWSLSVVSLVVAFSASAQSTAQADAALIALDQTNCEAATDALNKGMTSNEPKSFFIAGQLFESGICLKTDPAKAAVVYERAALLGDTESARSLALLHARGAGVPQSYKQAGRWYAVMRQEKKGVETPNADSYATPETIAKTYTEAVNDLAEQRMPYPKEAAVAGVTGKVRVRFDPRTGAASVVSSSDNVGLSMNHVGPNKHVLERALLAGYDDAVKALPKPDIPPTGDFTSEQEVKFDRNPNAANGPNRLQQLRR